MTRAVSSVTGAVGSVTVIAPAHIAVLSEVVDGLGPAGDVVARVRGEVADAEVMSTPVTVAVPAAVPSITVASTVPSTVTGTGGAVTMAVSGAGGGVVRIAAQNMVGGAALLVHEGS